MRESRSEKASIGSRPPRRKPRIKATFLYRLPSKTLASVRFPLGAMSKAEVRAKARELGLEVADKPESQDFVAGGGLCAPVRRQAPRTGRDRPMNPAACSGRHRGLPFYTIGQRRGLGISTGPEPLYVVKLEGESNRVVVGPRDGLIRRGPPRFRSLSAIGESPRGPIQSLGEDPPKPSARRLPSSRRTRAAAVEQTSIYPRRAIAPGQSLVLYDEGGIVLWRRDHRSSPVIMLGSSLTAPTRLGIFRVAILLRPSFRGCTGFDLGGPDRGFAGGVADLLIRQNFNCQR